MKFYSILLIIGAFLMGFTSCKHEEDLYKRKYTNGIYKDFNLHREKYGKVQTEDSVTTDSGYSLLFSMKEQLLSVPEEMNLGVMNTDATVMLNENYPMIAEKLDSAIARTMKKDSTWETDTLPDAISTALSGQAMVGLGTVGGFATMAEPALIWFTIVPMIGIPFFLMISLIAAAVAMGKINRGEIDARYKKWMRLWAVALLINLILGSIVLLHFTAL